MKIRQLFMPRPLRRAFKRARVLGVKSRGKLLTFGLALGLPRWVAAYLRERGLKGRVTVFKQGVMGVVTPAGYIRFTSERKAADRLAAEFAGWLAMREAGLGDIVAGTMELRHEGGRTLLLSEPLSPIAMNDRHAFMMPIVKRLCAAAVPQIPADLPATVDRGLALAVSLCGGRLPSSFADEAKLCAAFSRPLLTGMSHQDMHWRNVLRRGQQPVLIDLKKCGPGRILALDLLNMACLSLASQNGGNVLSEAQAAHVSGWREPGLAELLLEIDLPREVWGPAYVLHKIGTVAEKHGAHVSEPSSLLFRRLLSLDWTMAG